MPRRRRFLLSAGVAALNAGPLAIPRIVSDRAGDPRAFATFLVLVTIFCIVEASMVDEVPHGERNLATLATMTGVAIFGTFVIAILTEGRTAYDGIAIVSGAVAMASGVLLRCAAIHTLGARFVSELRVPAGERLVRSGVYRWLDHPSEVGLLVLTAGAATLFRSVYAVSLWAFALAPLTGVRIDIENAFLTERRRERIPPRA